MLSPSAPVYPGRRAQIRAGVSAVAPGLGVMPNLKAVEQARQLVGPQAVGFAGGLTIALAVHRCERLVDHAAARIQPILSKRGSSGR